jgi:hypothetical protein
LSGCELRQFLTPKASHTSGMSVRHSANNEAYRAALSDLQQMRDARAPALPDIAARVEKMGDDLHQHVLSIITCARNTFRSIEVPTV